MPSTESAPTPTENTLHSNTDKAGKAAAASTGSAPASNAGKPNKSNESAASASPKANSTRSSRPHRAFRLSWLIASGYFIPLCLSLALIGFLLHQQITRHLWTSTHERLFDHLLNTVGINLDAQDGRLGEVLWDNLSTYTPFTLVTELAEANQPARIIDFSGATIAQDGHDIELMPPPDPQCFSQAKLMTPFEAPYAVDWLSNTPGGLRYYCMLIPVSLNGHPDVFLQISTPWRFAEDLNSTLNQLILWGGLGSLLLSIIFSMFIGRRLSHPLEQLAKTANTVEAGDLSARTGIVCNQLEIQEVAKAFDQMVSQLEKSFASQKRFVADASHELKTPLTAISGMAELMEVATEEERERALTIMNREIARMSRLINDLLFLSRAENASPNPRAAKPELIDLHSLLREVVTSSQPANPQKEIILSEPVEATVLANGDNLSRIFHNLIENAQKYAPEATPIEVTCSLKHERVLVSVRDHGPGVSEKDLPHLFERFYRADTSRNRKTGGSGLGMAIVKALTEAAGGSASIRNHPQGGFEVTIALPLHRQASATT